MRVGRMVSLVATLLSTMVLAQSTSLPLNLQPLAPKSAVPSGSSQPDHAMHGKIAENYGRLPLSFEANYGQSDARVKFLSRTSGYSVFLTGDEAVLTLRGRKAKSPAHRVASDFAELAASLKGCPDMKQHPSAAKQRSSASCEGGRFARTTPMPRPTLEEMPGGVLRMKLLHANSAARVTGVDQMAGTINHFIGNDPAKWRRGVPTYAKVKYEGVYSGIDLVYYGNQRQLEYDFIVAPGADPRRIAFEVRGAKRIRRDGHGDLVLKMGKDEVRWHQPVVYQEKNGTRQLIAARYSITDTNRVAFAVSRYDASSPLYIDPLIYSTYLGGRGSGTTGSTDFPTMNPLQPTLSGGEFTDVFVAKLNAAGSALVYSTYLGGSLFDGGEGIAVDSAGNAYVIGQTTSNDFPTTPGAFQTVCNGGSNCDSDGDAFVAKLNPEGSALVYSTYLGGSDFDVGMGIAVDDAGNAYASGITDSADFPTTPGALQTVCNGGSDCFPNGDAFVAKINPTGSALVYSTFLGGSGQDFGVGIALDHAGNAYVTGGTGSTDFPTENPLQGSNGGGFFDAFIAKLNPSGSALVYSTYLGGSEDDYGEGIAVDGARRAYVTGETTSSNFPTRHPLQAAYGGGGDVFVAKINTAGSALVYSTYLGGTGFEQGNFIAVDRAGNAYISGITNSIDFPTKNPLQAGYGGNGDAFVAKLNPSGRALVYSTYLGGVRPSFGSAGASSGGGIAVDDAGNAYVTGGTGSTDFPTTAGALQRHNGGGNDAFVAKIYILAPTTTTLTSSPNPSAYGQAVIFTAGVTSDSGAPPDRETVTFMRGTTVLGIAPLRAGSASFTTSTLPVGRRAITAVYGGDSDFAGSRSKTLKQVVNKAE
jgi:Bacterial Ig-like domain (group 3)/Beta-propeller repeat